MRAGDGRFALPQVAVLELVRVGAAEASRIERINGAPVLRLRDSLLPVVPLSGVLGMDAAPAADGFVVVAQVGRQRFGILVDEVFHTEEIVVKPMSAKLRHLSLFAGNTILGDGAVVLIVDPNGIAERVAAGSRQDLSAAMADAPPATSGDGASYLVFRAGGDLRAVPLSLVTRLETVDAERIEWLGGRPVIQYRGRLMPLAVADAGMSVRREGSQDLLVFTPGERPTGLLVDAIVDIVSERVEVEPASGRPASSAPRSCAGGRPTSSTSRTSCPSRTAAPPGRRPGPPRPIPTTSASRPDQERTMTRTTQAPRRPARRGTTSP